MNRDRQRRHDEYSPDTTVSGAGRTNRRRFLARLVALGTVFALTMSGDDLAAAKKKGGKKRRKRGGNTTNGGGGNEEQAFLNLINDYRRKNGAGALSLQNQLDAAAQHHSDDMAKKNYFSHKLSNGDSPEQNIERFGYQNWRAIGENIAAGDETAAQVFASWKSSADHDKTMRNKSFTEIGIGRAYDKSAKYGWYWTTTFGDR